MPLDLRNVTVFMYAATTNENPKLVSETVDLKMYRTAENKQRVMAEVEYELKTNAVDCNLNLESNRFIGPYWEKPIKIRTSQKKIASITINDKDNSKICNYTKCDYKCKPDLIDLTEDDINYDTFNPDLVKDHIQEVSDIIKRFIEKISYLI